MALSISDLNQKTKATSPVKRSAKSSLKKSKAKSKEGAYAHGAATGKKRQSLRPWSRPKAKPIKRNKFSRADLKTSAIADDIGHDFSAARLDESWLFHLIHEKGLSSLLTTDGIKALGHDVIHQMAKRSYQLSRAQKSMEWLKKARLYPKLRIPLPPLFSSKSSD